MSTRHDFICNHCEKTEPTEYNGEHHIPPDGWRQLYNPITAFTEDIHLCPKCVKKLGLESE
jgi:hypothetical protein